LLLEVLVGTKGNKTTDDDETVQSDSESGGAARVGLGRE
jgi:hypothetical protein